MNEDEPKHEYAVFIPSYSRSDGVRTFDALRKHGYTGKIFIVVDDSDPEMDYYKQKFDNVIVFKKSDYADKFDIGDNGGNDKVVVYARNAMRDIVMQCGYRYYIVLDDDNGEFLLRYPENGKLAMQRITDLDSVFDITFGFLDESGALAISYAQGGDYIGGAESRNARLKIMRKAMNIWFLDTEKPFQFYGRINEDTTTYVILGTRGKLFFTLLDIQICTSTTQARKGGLTEIYTKEGTYLKTFYSVMMRPSCVKLNAMGDKHFRIHHNVSWNACTPMILNERYKKRGEK